MLPVEFATGLLTAGVAFAYAGAPSWALTVLVVGAAGLPVPDPQEALVSQEPQEQLAVRSTELAVAAGRRPRRPGPDALAARQDDRASLRRRRALREGDRSEAIGCSEAEQELVHTAGLLHDIGKFIFPDRILFADAKLTDDDWQIVKKHPAQGARVVGRVSRATAPSRTSSVRTTSASTAPATRTASPARTSRWLSRMISIADTYDVMTARDSYRDAGLARRGDRRAAPRVRQAARRSGSSRSSSRSSRTAGVSFQHTTDADFERELDFERRVRGLRRAACRSPPRRLIR